MSCFHRTAGLVYNRLVRELPIEEDELLRRLIGDFEITRSEDVPELSHHRIDSYVGGHWYVLEAMAHTFDPTMLSRTSMLILFNGALPTNIGHPRSSFEPTQLRRWGPFR